MHVSENPKWAAYILCTCTHVWCMDVRFDVYRFSSSPLLATSETTINAVILMHNEREKRKRTEIAKFRRASCSSIIILSLFFSLFLSFFLDATRNKTKFTRSYCIRLEKCYNFATFAVRTDSSFSDDTKKQKFAPFFTYTYVRISKRNEGSSFVHRQKLLFRLLEAYRVRESNVFTLFIYYSFLSHRSKQRRRSSASNDWQFPHD